jgi:hypothetical protein
VHEPVGPHLMQDDEQEAGEWVAEGGRTFLANARTRRKKSTIVVCGGDLYEQSKKRELPLPAPAYLLFFEGASESFFFRPLLATFPDPPATV